MTKKQPSADIYEFEDLTVIVPKDPVWDPALEDLQKRGDPTAIARLLRSQGPMPTHIGESLGIMLDPPAGYRGVRLRSTGQVGVEERDKAIKKLSDRKKQGEQLRALQGDGKVEAAAVEAEEKMGISRSAFFEAKKFGSLDAVFESQKILGHVDHQEKESGVNATKHRTRSRESRKK